MSSLPRSALLAVWGGAVLDHRAGTEAAVRAVQGDDEPHGVQLRGAAPLGDCDGLPGLLAGLRLLGVRGLRVVLPAPGDVLGLPGPAALNAEALEAGECVLTVGGPALALVPEVEEFGSVYETGHLVTWHVHPADPSLVTDVGSVAEAERNLREALGEATAALADLDVARWRPDAADRIQGLRSDGGLAGLLPPGTPSRSIRVLDLAWRVRGIARLAGEDDGAAVNGWEAVRRADALRGLDVVGRRAVVAAVNAPVERLRRPDGA